MNEKTFAWRGYAIAAAVLGAWLLCFRLLRGWQQGMDALARWVTVPYRLAAGWLCSFFPFSVAELVWAVFVLFCAAYLVHAVADVVRARGRRLAAAVHKLLGAGVIALAVYTGFTLLWGVNYYTTSFEQQAGVEAQPVSVQQLAEVTQWFAKKVNETADGVPRDAQNRFALPQDAVFAESAGLYAPLKERYPFLRLPPHTRPKPMLFSGLMSEINYTGFFFPFTGEANLNTQQPVCFLPSTIAHELAHVCGVAPEQTANFVAILACESSGNAAYAYSGYLLGYLHLSNALYRADRTAWAQVNDTLCAAAKADLAENNAYWAQFQSAAATAANTVYSSFLQSYDQTMGLKSYGAVVDLLVAYYGDAAA